MSTICNAINSGQLLATSSTVSFLSATVQVNSGTGLSNISNDGGATAGPILDMFRMSASPAVADIMGQMIFNGRSTTAVKREFARIESVIVSPTNTAEAGQINLYTTNAGAPVLQTSWLNTGGQYRGNNTNTAPPTGYLGEQITSVIAPASPVSLTNNTAANITSINLTPGIWDITSILGINGTLTGTQTALTITTSSGTIGSDFADGTAVSPIVSSAASDYVINIPAYRQLVSTTTTYFMVARALFSIGTAGGYGRLSAVRVG